MSETPKKLSLDAALRAWPEVEKSPMEWEEMARSIDARLAAGDLGTSGADVSDDNLLIHPLGQIPGEGHNSGASVTTEQTPRKHAFSDTETRKGETMTMQPDRSRDRRSLQDLAKLASTGSLTPPPPSVSGPLSSPSVAPGVPSAPPSLTSARPIEAKSDDSGIVDLAMAAQSDPQAAVRAQTTPLASGGLFDEETQDPASVRPGPVSQAPHSGVPASFSSGTPSSQQLQQPMPSMPPVSSRSVPPASLAPSSQGAASLAHASPASQASQASQASLAASSVASSSQAAQPRKKGGVVIVLALLGAAAIAAGGFLFVKNQNAKAEAAAAAAKPVETVAAKPVETAAPAATVAAAEPTPSAPEMDPNALPSSPDPKAAAAAKPGTKVAAVAAAAAAPAKPKDEGPAKLTQKDLAPSDTGPAGDLGAAMKGAVGDKDKAQTPAASENGPQFAAGTVPQKPSQGAVTGAIGAVLPTARACLGPDDAVSRASVTFTSGGTVQSVNVSGGAAGKPAGECIKAALMKAKVAPFAEASYTAPVTVRH